MIEYIAKPFKFNFKKRTVKDETGQVIGEVAKKPSITVDLPVLSAAGVIEVLAAGPSKEADVIMDAVNFVFYQAARQQFDDVIENLPNADDEVKSSDLNFDKLQLSFLANLPPATRGGAAISEDEWNFFFQDYLAVMVAATGKEERRIANQIEHFKKPNRCKANQAVLEVLVDQLSIYISKSANIEDTAQAADRLMGKFQGWIDALAVANDPDAL
jgi:hypothetical protein